MSLKPFLELPMEDEEGTSAISHYELYAVVAHSGVTPNSGHYYTYARSSAMIEGASDERDVEGSTAWCLLNDESVQGSMSFADVASALSGSDAGLDTAYLLFYRQSEASAAAGDAATAAAQSTSLEPPEAFDALDALGEDARFADARQQLLQVRACQAHAMRMDLASDQRVSGMPERQVRDSES